MLQARSTKKADSIHKFFKKYTNNKGCAPKFDAEYKEMGAVYKEVGAVYKEMGVVYKEMDAVYKTIQFEN